MSAEQESSPSSVNNKCNLSDDTLVDNDQIAKKKSVADSDTDEVEFENAPNLNTVKIEEVENTEITLSDEDSNKATTSNCEESTSNFDDSISPTNHSGLRRKRKINYGEMVNVREMGNRFPKREKTTKDVLDIFFFSNAKIAKFTQNLEMVDQYTKCKIHLMTHDTEAVRLNAVKMFFQKCGQQFESFQIQHNDEVNYSFLKSIFKYSTDLKRLDYRYRNQEDAYQLLKLVKNLSETNGLPSLTSLKLISVCGSESLRLRHIALLSEIRIQFQSLELGDALWEDVNASTIENFLDKQKLCLETLIINGGFRGDGDKERILISLPKMEALKNLRICHEYTFLSEFKKPSSKKERVIALDVGSTDEPFKIAIKFTSDLPKLERLTLGNLIDIEDLMFSSVRKLTEFRCGSFWNLSIRLPIEGSRKSLMESTVTEFQFPDTLKDPLFIVKVAKHFPNLKKVWLYLPSVPVLRAFFKAFENSVLKELYLKTQFDFEKTMESCLLPEMRDVLQKSQETETVVQTLMEYKHFDEYIRYYNVELPVAAEDLMEGHSAGICALKSLKVLCLEHIPRTLLIPVPEDERKWYDHNCKFMSTTFGYKEYPMNPKCHKEILKLNLSEYVWKNIKIKSSYTDDFYAAGFVDIPVIVDADDNKKTFTQKGTQVKILPSMLLPSMRPKFEKK